MIANPPFFLQEQRRANTLQPPVRDKSLAVWRKEKPKEFLVQSTRTRTAHCHVLGLCAPGFSPRDAPGRAVLTRQDVGLVHELGAE